MSAIARCFAAAAVTFSIASCADSDGSWTADYRIALDEQFEAQTPDEKVGWCDFIADIDDASLRMVLIGQKAYADGNGLPLTQVLQKRGEELAEATIDEALDIEVEVLRENCR